MSFSFRSFLETEQIYLKSDLAKYKDYNPDMLYDYQGESITFIYSNQDKKLWTVQGETHPSMFYGTGPEKYQKSKEITSSVYPKDELFDSEGEPMKPNISRHVLASHALLGR